jgi:hypothetical protein
MSADKEEKFDKILYQALKRHSEPVPADFAGRMLRQIREAENRRILARVVMEERLALAGCIVLGIMAIVAVVVFPSIAVSFKELAGTSVDKITQAIRAIRYEWQLYTVLAGVFGFVICSLVDLLVSDS